VLLLLEVELGPGPGHGLSLLGDQPTQVVSLLLQTGPMLLIFRKTSDERVYFDNDS
jgi:hypothetical protein